MPRLAPAMARQSIEQIRRALARFHIVDVRIGAERHQRIGMREHRVGDVGMQVQARHERHVPADGLSDAREQFALGIVERLAHGGAMQLEVDGVVCKRLHVTQDGVADALEGIVGDV